MPEFLRNDLGACLRVKEPVADHLANDFLRAAVFGLGASLGAEEALRALVTELGQELKIALAAVFEAGHNSVNRLVSALSGYEHG